MPYTVSPLASSNIRCTTLLAVMVSILDVVPYIVSPLASSSIIRCTTLLAVMVRILDVVPYIVSPLASSSIRCSNLHSYDMSVVLVTAC